MRCKECGKKINRSSKFCTYCGAEVTGKRSGKQAAIVVTIIVILFIIAGSGIYYLLSGGLNRQFNLDSINQAEEDHDEASPNPEDEQKDIADDSETDDHSVQEHSASAQEDDGQSDIQDEKRLMYQAYYEKLIEKQEKYGRCDNVTASVDDDAFIDENIYLKGLCCADLIDFNNDGSEELMLAYRDPQTNSDDDFGQNYIVEIWTYENSRIEKVYEGAPTGDWEHGQEVMINKADSGELYLFFYTEEEALSEWLVYDNGAFHLVKSIRWAWEEYEIDGVKVSEEELRKEKEDWSSSLETIEYGLQNCGYLCEDTVNILNNTFETLCEYLGIEWTDTITYYEELSQYDMSLWGKELVGQWENLSSQSMGEWIQLSLYADGTVGLHEHNILHWGSYDIDTDGSVYLYLNNALIYSNVDGKLYGLETDICIHLTESSDDQHMYFQEAYDTYGDHSFKGTAILSRTSDISQKSSVTEEVQMYRERISNH